MAQSSIPVRRDLSTLLAAAAVHPIVITRALAAGHSPRSILAFLSWRESARVLGTRGIRRADGRRSPLSRLLPPDPPSARSSRPSIGLAMIAQDEEEAIGQALQSAAPFVDEMVVIDGGSSDRTVERATAAGARVVQVAWPNDFARQRNTSLDELRTEWALVLDADEALEPGLGTLLTSIVTRTHADGVHAPS
jgi:hypothetical protein